MENTETKVCAKCGRHVEVPIIPLEIKDVLPLTPEEEAELTEQKRQEEAEQAEKSFITPNEE